MTAAPPPAPASREGWEGILAADEQIVWQGQPDPRLELEALKASQVIFGLATGGFAVFWSVMAAQSSDGGLTGILLPLFGLFFVVVSFKRAGGHIFWDSYRRKRTWYTLTDRRAFVATQMLGRKNLAFYPIDRETVIDFNGKDPGTIWFAYEYQRNKQGSSRKKVGFEQIPDALRVHNKVVAVQNRPLS